MSTSIGNFDETFVHFDLKSRKVIAERNAKTVYQLSCLTGEQLVHFTIVAFVSSDGHSFPPLFISKEMAVFHELSLVLLNSLMEMLKSA